MRDAQDGAALAYAEVTATPATAQPDAGAAASGVGTTGANGRGAATTGAATTGAATTGAATRGTATRGAATRGTATTGATTRGTATTGATTRGTATTGPVSTGTPTTAATTTAAATTGATAAGTPTYRTLTDARGRFELEGLPEGELILEVTRLGYAPARMELALSADTQVSFALDPAAVPLSAIVVSPGHFGVMRQTVATRQTLSRRQLETMPQLGEDIFRAVARVPGVVTSDISASFGVRGSRPDEVLVMFDGLELYEPFHLKDFDNALSIVDVTAVGGVDLITGGFGAQYGDRLGGVFDIRSDGVAPGPARTHLGLSVTALRAGSRGSFADDRGRWLFSVRRGYLELALKLTGDDDQHGSPTYYDVFGRVDYQLGRQVLSAHLLHASDLLEWQGFSNDPRVTTRYGSSYGWLSLQGPLGSRLSHHATLATGALAWNRFTDPGPGARALPVAVRDERAFDFVALRQDWTAEWADWTLTRLGVHLRRLGADYDYDAWRSRDFPVDGLLVERPDTTRVELAPRGSALDAWALQRVRLLPSLVAEAGVHWSRRAHTGDDDWTPRLNLAFSPHRRTTLRASWGVHAQAQGIYKLSVVDGEDAFGFSDRARQLGAGLEQVLPALALPHGLRLPPGVTLRAEAYLRRLTRVRPRWVNPDFPDDMFPEMSRARLRLEPTGGRARGLELSVAGQSAGVWSWSGSYVLAQVTDRVDGVDVPRARDQRHAVGVDVAYAPDDRWRLAAAWQYHSGWPRTPVSFKVDRMLDGRPYVHRIYAPYNSERLPAYHRFDLRASRTITTRRGEVSLFFDVFNLYNRRNYRAIVPYTVTDSQGRVYRRERVERLLPRLPSLGVSWVF